MIVKSKKGDLEFDTLIPWIIAIVVLVLVFILYFVLSGKGTNAINYLLDLIRFGK